MGYLIFHVFSLRWIELFRATSVMLIVMGIEKVGMLCYYKLFHTLPQRAKKPQYPPTKCLNIQLGLER